MGLWPWAMRRIKANVVSKIGRPKIKNGTAKEMIAQDLKRPWIEMVAKIYPRKVAPVSPINILAGFILYGIKPTQAPTSAAMAMATCASETSSEITSTVVAEIAETLDKLIKEGKTRYIGLSNWTGERIDEFNRYAAAHSLSKVIAGQIQYSAATAVRENNDPTLVLMDDAEYAFYKRTKMPVFAFAAQAKGFFQKMEKGGEASLSEKACERYLSDENRARFLRVKEVAASHGVSSGEAALASLICNPDFEVIPIVGCKNIAQLEDTVKAADLKLSTGEIEYIKRG